MSLTSHQQVKFTKLRVAEEEAVKVLIKTILPAAAVVSPSASELKANALLATGVTSKLL